MRTLALTLALASLPSLAGAQQWPSVSGQVTVQTAPPLPPPPPQPVYVQQPQYALPPPPPPPVGYAPQYAQPTLVTPRLNYNLVYGPDPVSSGARAYLVTVQSINGMALGLSFAGIAQARSPSIYSGAMLLGGGIGAVSSLLASRNGVTSGEAGAVNHGTFLGGVGAMFTGFALANSIKDGRAVAGIVAGGLTLGTGAGILWAAQSPLSGRVEFTASMGYLGAFTAAHLFLATRGYGTFDGRDDDPSAVLGWSSLGATAAGLVAGALLAPNVQMSAARVRWMSLSALGGWFVIGSSSALLAADGDGEDVLLAYSIGSMVGVGGGLALGYFLTQNTDSYWERMHEGVARRTGPTLNVSPGGPGGSPGLSLGGTF